MCGMVRKVDELGRIVIPKEMRRVLNIKCGTSVEMNINAQNQVVLTKFFELNNIISSAESLINFVFEEFSFSCLIANDEKIIACKGLNKKEFLNQNLIQNLTNRNTINLENFVVVEEQCFVPNFTSIFSIETEGFTNGYLIVFSDKIFNAQAINTITSLTKFFSLLLKF